MICGFGTVSTWVRTRLTDTSSVVIVTHVTWTGWSWGSVGSTSDTVIGMLFTARTTDVTDDDLGRTDWDIDNFDGLDDWLWWDTLWWLDQVSGTSGTVESRVDTGSTNFITNWTCGLAFNVIGSVWTVTGWGWISVSGTDSTVVSLINTGVTFIRTDCTVFSIGFIVTICTFTDW